MEPVVVTRKRLQRLVEAFPGLHLRELARQAGLSEALAGYHMDVLAGDGHVLSLQHGAYRRFYPANGPMPEESDREVLALLRHRVHLPLLLILLEEGTATHHLLTKRLGLAKSTVSYHIKNLLRGGVVVAADGGGLRLADPPRVERLLLRWEPPRTHRERCGELWDRFAQRRPGPDGAPHTG